MTEPRPGDAFQPGDVLNNTYRIEALLGRGGTSDVYRARSEISGRLVAIKVLKAEFATNDDYLILMTREEEIREIRHDAIVRYSENHRTSDGLVYLLMDFIDGPGLDRRLKDGPMSADDLMVVCKRVGEGLQAAHARSIVHRDLSPDNIILRDNDPAQAVVIDFGIAKDTNPGAETIVGNEFAGKYAYAAPEQLSGKTDARSDIYSLGALLLANFRGKSPDVGANPMEVVQKKTQTLDTSDVPEPFKTLLDKMTAPDPNDRFQTMAEVLAFLDNGGAQDALSDATVIVAPPRAQKIEVAPKAEPAPKKAEKSGGMSGGLIAAAAAVVVIGGGAAAFFGGLFGGGGPSYPAVSPFALVIDNMENLPVAANGYVPDADLQNALVARMAALGGTANLTLASGDISDSWSQDVLTVLDDLAPLNEWQLSLEGNTAEINGTTTDQSVLAALDTKYSQGWPGGLSGTFDVALTSLFLAPAEVEGLLTDFADCGPLHLINAPLALGYGADDPILVAGSFASEASRDGLQSSLDAIAQARPVVINADILNPTLCLVENYLPNAPESDITIAFEDGATGRNVPSGEFVVGQNPVIDVIIPETLSTGYLSVSVLDVSGNVFHLLPNIGRSDNSVETLRASQDGAVPLRVAYRLDEERPSGGIAFAVDGTSLGKSKILVIHSDAPLFREMRPTTESALGYAEALSKQVEATDRLIRSLDSRILTSQNP